VQHRQHVPGRAFCPECGQKYAVPEDELKRRAGLRFRATCRACGTPFSVMWADEALVTEREEILQTDQDDERDVLAQGVRVGKYEIEEPLSSGGSSTVYRAFELGANRTVALKVLHQDPESDYGVRFRREVEVQGNLKHPNLMPIFDQGDVDGKPFYTMELLHKPVTMDSIIRLFRSNRLGYNPSLRTLNSMDALLRQVLLPVSRAIQFANVNGVIHRDLKPTNVLVDGRTLRVYVIDFGICHVFRSTGTRLVLRAGDADPQRDDTKSHTMGTLRMMPPEQARGEFSRQGDVWALGCLLYYILAGDAPVAPAIDLRRVGLDKRLVNLQKIAASCREAGDEEEAAFYEQRVEELRSGSMRSMRSLLRDAVDANYQPMPEGSDPGLAAIALKAMAPDPADRYEDAQGFINDIMNWLSGRPVRALAARMGAVRAFGYRTALLATRHKTVGLSLLAIVLTTTLGISAWSWRAARKVENQLSGWLADAKRSNDPTVQEEFLVKYLAVRPGNAEAEALLRNARTYKPLRIRIREARDARVTVADLLRAGDVERAKELANDTVAVLLKSVLPDLQSLPETYPGRKAIDEVRSLAAFLRGRRMVELRAVPPDAEVSRVNYVSRSVKALKWDSPTRIGTGPPTDLLPLTAGTYVFVIEQGGRSLYLPLEISVASAHTLRLTCPIDPAKLPDGMVPIIGGDDLPFGDLRYQAEIYRSRLKPYLIDECEVTNREYAAFLNALPADERRARVPRRTVSGQAGRFAPLWDEQPDGTWKYADDLEQHPVAGISNVDAQRYAESVGKRLPTREEWEHAARGADGRTFPFGDRLDRDACNAATGLPAGVRTFKSDRSPFGLWDMGGNVAEWTATSGTSAIVKGGSFDLPRYRASVAAYGKRDSDKPYPDVGFRCAKDLR